MSHTPPPDSPVPLALAGRSIRPRFGQLEQGCRQLVMNHLDQQLACAFEQVDDALFAQAEKAANNLEQALYFDGMRAVRQQRTQIVRRFHQQLAGGFAAYLEGLNPNSATPPPEERQPLSLLAHEELEENVLLTNMVKRCRHHCQALLPALEERLAQLCPDPQAALHEDSPFSPEAVAGAFRLALPGEGLPLAIRRVLYALFEQQVMASLDELYTALDRRLREAGILPRQEERPTRPRHPVPPVQRSERPAAQLAPVATATTAQPASESAQLFQGVTRLLGRRHLGPPATAAEAPSRAALPLPELPRAGTYSESELLAALNRLQQISARDIDSQLQQPQDVTQLRARLQAELEAACTLPGQQLRADDADIIDLVGMLFAFILDDPGLPDRCKTVLSHLHTPYLKLALRDRELFTRDDHPARRLLDSMARAGARFVEDSDASGLLAKMQDIVEHIIQDLGGERAGFERLLEEFETHLRRLQQRVELREHRTLSAARGRDRLYAARRRAGEQIRQTLIGRSLPPLIQALLENSWHDLLALIHLRQGEQSEEWRRACLTGEQLAWSVTPLDRSGRERLQRERLELLEALRGGLMQLGCLSDEEIRRLLQDVVTCQHAVQARQPELAARLLARLPDSPLGALLHEQGENAEAAAGEGQLSAELEAQLEQLRALPFGSLFAFHEDGQVHRLRLSWVSPATRHYLFIDPCGEHSRTWPAAHLARALQDGSVRLLGEPSDTPLMERALQAIYRVLQRLEEPRPAGD